MPVLASMALVRAEVSATAEPPWSRSMSISISAKNTHTEQMESAALNFLLFPPCLVWHFCDNELATAD